MGLTVGQELGAYRILGPLGAGGMGEVYRARDTRLDREVAVKVLPDRTARDERVLSRFRRETKALAALSHPNILMILDVGEHDGVHYAVMELLEGETLRERLRRSGLEWRRALDIGASIADGLAAAHGRGIVHRDLKPENLFLTRDGVVKVLDFGLARTGMPSEPHAATVTATRPGVVLGTVNYMSPEQVRGQPTDARSDIFSLGCVLYEMLAGRPPFARETPAETMTAILRMHPDEVSSATQQAPVDVDPIVGRCLEKDPNDRFHSARDLAFSLREALARGRRHSVRGKSRSAGVRALVGVAALIAVIAGGWWAVDRVLVGTSARERSAGAVKASSANVDHSRDADATIAGAGAAMNTAAGNDSASIPRLAVLPFEDLSADPQEWYADGITDAVNFDLAKISGLWVAAHPSVRKYRNLQEPITVVGKELGVTHVVLGSVSRGGDRVQIRVQILEAATERHVWSERFDLAHRDYLGIQNDVARAIASAVRVTLTPEDEERLSVPATIDPTAYEGYMMGMSFVRQKTLESLHTALELFDEALARDPDFALGYAGRAAAYRMLAGEFDRPHDTMPKVKEAAEKAIALDGDLAEAYTELGYYRLSYEHNWDGSREAFERAIELNPDYSKARIGLAMYLAAMKHGQEALQQLDYVEQNDPKQRLLDDDYGFVPFMAREYERTIRIGEAALAADPQWWAAHLWMAQAYSQLGEHEKAVDHAKMCMELTGSLGDRAMAGGVLAVAGGEHREEAKAIYASLKDTEDTGQYVCPYELASIPIGLGDHDTAFTEMDRACEARADCLAWLQVDPRVDPLRDDPRFDDLLLRVGFEPPVKVDSGRAD
jgi:serine/threonine-protein kinase